MHSSVRDYICESSDLRSLVHPYIRKEDRHKSEKYLVRVKLPLPTAAFVVDSLAQNFMGLALT